MASRSRTNRSKARLGSYLCATIAASLLVAPVVAAPAFASTGCGEFSFGFEGTRLLNDGVSNEAGPFPAELPAGTYELTLVSGDQHSEQVDIPTQPAEQFVVVLDSGYVSPPSLDVPDDADEISTTHPNQEIGASTTISVRHIGSEGINSVNVLCVGFTPTAAPAGEPIVEETVAEDPAEEPAGEEPVAEEPVEEPAGEEPVAEEPIDDLPQNPVAQPVAGADPTTPEEALPVEETSEALPIEEISEALPIGEISEALPIEEISEALPIGATEEAPPVQEISEPASITRDLPEQAPDPAAVDPEEPVAEVAETVIEPEVLGVVEQAPTPSPADANEAIGGATGQLAVTGPPQTIIFFLAGVGFLLLGSVLVMRERLLGA